MHLVGFITIIYHGAWPHERQRRKRETDATRLTVFFRNFAKGPKQESKTGHVTPSSIEAVSVELYSYFSTCLYGVILG